jgi:protein-disulfide isomerase
MGEFEDYQCEFCDRFAKVTEPKVNSTYIQTGDDIHEY